MNYYKGSRIGTQILKFLGSTHVSGGTQRGVHGHMVAIWKGNPLLEYCYLRRQMVENVMHGAVYFTIHSLSHNMFIHGMCWTMRSKICTLFGGPTKNSPGF